MVREQLVTYTVGTAGQRQVRIQGVGAGAAADVHPWDGAAPFKMHHSIAFKHQYITGRPVPSEQPPLQLLQNVGNISSIFDLWC